MSAAIAPNPNDPQAPLGMPARPWWIGYIRQLHLDIPLAVESGGTGKNTPLDASDIAETSTLKILTATERTKLTLIAEGANNYTHPASHPQSMIEGLGTAIDLKQDKSNAVTTDGTQVVTGRKTFREGSNYYGPEEAANHNALMFGCGSTAFWMMRQYASTPLSIRGSITGQGPWQDTLAFVFNGGIPSAQFYGTPTAPTATAGTNTTQIATTAFVQAKAAGALLTSGTMTETSTGSPGMIRYDSGKLYVCVATDTWIFFEKGSWT